MARKQSPKQREVVGRVMHEFKHGGLESSSGRKVKNPRQAIAIALHEAGASRDETPARNKRDLARTQAKERQAEAGRKGGKGAAPSAARPRSGAAGADESRAALYQEATRPGSHEAGRSRPVTHDQGAARTGHRPLRTCVRDRARPLPATRSARVVETKGGAVRPPMPAPQPAARRRAADTKAVRK
jgi:hypothetical protein